MFDYGFFQREEEINKTGGWKRGRDDKRGTVAASSFSLMSDIKHYVNGLIISGDSKTQQTVTSQNTIPSLGVQALTYSGSVNLLAQLKSFYPCLCYLKIMYNALCIRNTVTYTFYLRVIELKHNTVFSQLNSIHLSSL